MCEDVMNKRYAVIVDDVAMAMLSNVFGGRIQYLEVAMLPVTGNGDMNVLVTPTIRLQDVCDVQDVVVKDE